MFFLKRRGIDFLNDCHCAVNLQAEYFTSGAVEHSASGVCTFFDVETQISLDFFIGLL